MSKDTERVALEVELARVRLATPFPTSEGIARHSARVARLEAQLAELGPTPEPQTFKDGSSTIVRDSSFGSRFERPEELVADDSDHSHEFDPMLREFGNEIT